MLQFRLANRARSPPQAPSTPAVLGSILEGAQSVIDLAETLSAHRAECEKIAEQTRVIADFLAVHAAAQSDADLPTLKRFVELEKDMQNTLDDLSRIASRSPPIPRQASQSPPPYARDAQPAASAVQITLPARSRSPIAALKRVTWSIAGDFEVARCTERLQHAHRILTELLIIPPSYDSPTTRVPERVTLRVWDDPASSSIRRAMQKGGLWYY